MDKTIIRLKDARGGFGVTPPMSKKEFCFLRSLLLSWGVKFDVYGYAYNSKWMNKLEKKHR